MHEAIGKTWLEVALNGPWTQQRQPGIPVKVSDIVEQGIACVKAGASVVHVHAYDEKSGQHIEHTKSTVNELARRARNHPRFAAELNEHTIALMAKSAPLHDIGKVGIPDHILLKPGKLDADEWKTMKTHAELGAKALRRAISDTKERAEFLDFAIQIAHHHHERWDGSGYPDGLVGEQTPLAARLMAIADVFDALISRRVYKEAMPFGQALQIMSGQRGQHFDPDLLDLFLADFDAFCDIARRFPDEAPAAT